MRSRSFLPVLASILVAAAACATLSASGAAPLAPGWARESFHVSTERCGSGECRTRLVSAAGHLDVTSRARTYARHEIPGWDSGSSAARVLSSVAQGIIRRSGALSDETVIGLGTRVTTGGTGGEWQLRCSIFWIDDQEVAYSRSDGDHVTQATRRTEGTRCDAVASPDTGIAQWRFHTGITPPRDSLAIVYDSLASGESPAVSARPPMALERLTAGGRIDARYVVSRDTAALTFADRLRARKLSVTGASGAPLAVIHFGIQLTLDMASGATEEETQIVRLVGATLWVPLADTRR